MFHSFFFPRLSADSRRDICPPPSKRLENRDFFPFTATQLADNNLTQLAANSLRQE